MTPRDLLPARAATSALFFGNGFGIGTWAAQLPRFKAALGLSDSELSLGLLAFSLGAVALMPVVGSLTARIGSRVVVLMSAFAFTLALLCLSAAPNLAVFAAIALMAGASNGAMDVSMNTNATVVEAAWSRPIMSSFHAFFSLGGLAGAAASGLLIAAGFGIAATLLLSCLVIAGLFLAAAFRTMEDAARATEGHGFALPRGAVMTLAVLALFCFLVEGVMVDWTAIYLQSVAGASLEAAVAGFGAFSLAMTFCRFLGDLAVRRLGRIRTVQFGGMLAALGLALAMVAPLPVPATIGFALVGIGLSNVVPVLFSAAAGMKGIPSSVGVAMVATLGYGGLLMGPPIIGFGADLVGLRSMLILLIAFALAVTLLSQRAFERSTV
jgi:MFS family permease